MHGDDIGGDPLVDIFLSKRAVFDKHVHFHAVTERLMRNQSGYFR